MSGDIELKPSYTFHKEINQPIGPTSRFKFLQSQIVRKHSIPIQSKQNKIENWGTFCRFYGQYFSKDNHFI